MDNLNDRALGSGFDIFIFLLAMLTMVTFAGIGYKVMAVKNTMEQDRNALKQGDNLGETNFEDQKASVYTYHGQTYTGAGPRIRAVANGDSVTGASVFTEVQNLPDTVTKIYKDGGLILVNDVLRKDQQTVSSHRNVAYYIDTGKTDELLKYLKVSCHVDQAGIYTREYRFSPSGINGGDRVVAINYH